MYFDKFFQNGKYLNYIKENKGTDRVQSQKFQFSTDWYCSQRRRREFKNNF